MAIEIDGIPEFEALLKKLPRLTLIDAGGSLQDEAEQIMTRSKRDFVPVDTGRLRSSGFVQAPKLWLTKVSVTLGYGTDYAVFVHEGRGPGRAPPVSAVAGWAKRHGGIPPFLVARAIGRRGTTGSKFLTTPMMMAATGMGKRVAKRLEKRWQQRL